VQPAGVLVDAPRPAASRQCDQSVVDHLSSNRRVALHESVPLLNTPSSPSCGHDLNTCPSRDTREIPPPSHAGLGLTTLLPIAESRGHGYAEAYEYSSCNPRHQTGRFGSAEGLPLQSDDFALWIPSASRRDDHVTIDLLNDKAPALAIRRLYDHGVAGFQRTPRGRARIGDGTNGSHARATRQGCRQHRNDKHGGGDTLK
jgi:hypothetical protein